MLKVCKFGGSSVAGASQFEKVKSIVREDSSRRIVVVSAAGKRDQNDHKITDLLYLCHAHLTYGVSCEDIFEQIKNRYVEIRNDLGLSYRIEDDFEILKAKLSKDIPVEDLVSRGEYMTAKLMAEYLGFHFLDANESIFMGYDGKFNGQKISEAIQKALKAYGNLVIPGFYGVLPSGRIRLMSRGGSDITGALAAAASQADIYENWTDVSGILMADPKIVEEPRPIPEITYSELRELAYMGASVLHEESILPVKEAGIALNIRNTNRPQDEGTMIVDRIDSDDSSDERFITGIAGRRNFDIITVRKHNITDNFNSDLRLSLEVLDHYKVSVEHITMGLDSFAFVVSQSALGDKLYDIINDIQSAIGPDDVQVQDNIALVAAVGRKMTFRPGISGKLFKALGEEGINIRTIAQGADELSIIIGVDNSQFETTIRVLYEGFAG